MCSVARLCLILCSLMDCSPPGSSVHRIFLARILEWVTFSRGSFLQGSNPSLLHSQVASLLLSHQGSPSAVTSWRYCKFSSRQLQSKEPYKYLGFPVHINFVFILFSSVQFSSVTQPCLTLCDPMDCSTPGFPIHHQLSGFTQTHVH